MSRLIVILVVCTAAAVLAILGACAPLATFNTLVPKDDARRVATGAPYGEGPRRTLDIYSSGAKNAPVIVFIYGGSWANGDKNDYGFPGRALASSGFTVVIPDYRLFPEVAFPGFVQDGAAAVA